MIFKNKYWKLGFKFGLIHYTFAKYINDNYKDRRVLCNSRDTYITYKILKDIFKNDNVEYIYTSRKVLFNTAWNTNVPIDSEENRFIYESIIYGRYKNVYELLNYLGFVDNFYFHTIEFDKLIQNAGFSNLYDDITPFQTNHEQIQSKVKRLVKSLQPHLYSLKRTHTAMARRRLSDLIKDEDVFVDVGWNGTTQYFLENLLGINLNGVYFETFSNVIKLPKEIKTDKFMKKWDNYCRGMQGLLEGCYFIAPHGTVVSYEHDITLEAFGGEQRQIKEDIISGALSFCKLYHKLPDIKNALFGELFIKSYCEGILSLPTLDEVHAINKIMHNNCGYNYSVVNYNGVYNDIDYRRSFWKTGYKILALQGSLQDNTF